MTWTSYIPVALRPEWHRMRAAARRPRRFGWAVQATVDEPVSLLRAFAAHHLAAGAAEVHLYLDRDDPAAAADLRRDERVRVTVCDAAYWRRAHWRGRPVLHTSRQIVNARRAYRETDVAWMLFADADEFLLCPEDFSDQLTNADPAIDFLRIDVAERCYFEGHAPAPTDGLYGGSFRRAVPLGPKRTQEIYADHAPYLRQNVLGHCTGKSIVRTGRVLQMGLHWPKSYASTWDRPGVPDDPAYHRFVEGAVLAHFDGLTPLHWLLKLLRKYQLAERATGKGRDVDLANRTDARKRQIMAVHAARSDGAALQALTDLQVLSAATVDRLRTLDGLADMPLAPDTAATALFPDHEAPTVGSFDAALRERNAALIAQFGLPE